MDTSQNGESKILEEVLLKNGIEKPVCIEIGAWDGYHLSNTRYFKDKGCMVDMFDADTRGSTEVKEFFVTQTNAKDCLLKQYNLLSIDIDGNDYWILKAILEIQKPDVICFEINSQLPLEECLVMPYNEDHKWDGSWFFGMSYLAGVKLCNDYGYKIYDVVNRTNIIAVKNTSAVKPKLYSFGLTWSHPENNNKFLKLKL